MSPVYGGECVEYYVATAVSEERNVSCNVRSGEDSLYCSFSLEGNASDYLYGGLILCHDLCQYIDLCHWKDRL